VPYDRDISGSTDDMADQIERIFDDQPADPAPEPPGGDAAEGDDEVTSDLEREMDLLHDQLEAAFTEVVGKVDRIAATLVDLERDNDAQRRAVEQLTERSDRTMAMVEDLVATLDAAVAASREPWEPDPVAVDLGPIAERLGHLDQAVAATRRELVRLHDAPLAVDTSRLEDVASRGSLHNAADIANLRREVEALTESARSQDRALRDLRATLEWIKDRMLR
jgi:hypothetical protein